VFEGVSVHPTTLPERIVDKGNAWIAAGFGALSALGTICSFGLSLFPLLDFSPVIPDVWTHVWSIKYRLITKLNTQIENNLRDEFFSLISP
jgi:hypothetical protein